MTTDVQSIGRAVQEQSRTIASLITTIEQTIVGQRHMIERLLIGLLCDGHVLLEGVPGLAKTLTVSTLAGSIHAKFSRIQFTPDLLPADLVGTLIYNPRDGVFTPRKGPIFANIVLADEINRAPAKVQSALLESMQERQVTIGDATYPLDDPFLVLATQNPIEQEGTYPLPEAQVDRFMLKVKVGYPSKAEERKILDRMATTREKSAMPPVVQLDAIREARGVVDSIYIDDKVKDYIVEVVHATRHPKEHGLDIARLIEFGASPRATIALTLASKAHAFLQGRGFVTPQDVKSIGLDVLRHRVIAGYEAEAEGVDSDVIVKKVFDHVPVP
ncbi:MAG TPA: MoxR family ATPase [Phycisphaerales bacterium]|nr:MoxR family ATPase [Phycisphaerales bacterium]